MSMEVELRTRIERLTRWMLDDALPLWWERAADLEACGWNDVLAQDGSAPPVDRRARVPGRQTYVYVVAGDMGWSGPWRQAAEHGLKALARHYRRPDGLFRTKVRPDGSPVDEAALLYDQAFVLLALASLKRVALERAELTEKAGALLERIRSTFAHPAGGFRDVSAEQPFQSNHHMHLFEAALAWEAVDADPRWPALADQVGSLCLARFIDGESGALREFFDAAWAPAPGIDGRIVEPGHQFEWAWLLERWGRTRGRTDARAAARRLFDIGVAHGIDGRRGVAINALLDDFSVHDPVARLWPQTERIKAALALASAAEDADERRAFEAEAARGVDGLWPYLRTPLPGLWYDKMKPDGGMANEPAPASSFYHIACAIAELAAYVA